MKSVVKSFEKWAKRNLPNGRSDDTMLAVANAAYLAGRRDLQNEQKRRARLEAERAQVAKQTQKRTWYEALAEELPRFDLTLVGCEWGGDRKPIELHLLHTKSGGYPRLVVVRDGARLRDMAAVDAAEMLAEHYMRYFGHMLDKP